MLAAVRAARKAGAAAIVVAAPAASQEAVILVRIEADCAVILQVPARLSSIGQWYEHFEQLEDEEVCRLLELNRRDQKALQSNTMPEKPVDSFGLVWLREARRTDRLVSAK